MWYNHVVAEGVGGHALSCISRVNLTQLLAELPTPAPAPTFIMVTHFRFSPPFTGWGIICFMTLRSA